MAVPFLLVIFLGGAYADVMEIDVSQCDVESPSFLQLKHQGEQAEQDILQLLVTSAGISRPGVSQPGVVYKCNVTHHPDFSQDCADLTTGRIPAGVPFSFVWEVEVLRASHRFPGDEFSKPDQRWVHCSVPRSWTLQSAAAFRGLSRRGWVFPEWYQHPQTHGQKPNGGPACSLRA